MRSAPTGLHCWSRDPLKGWARKDTLADTGSEHSVVDVKNRSFWVTAAVSRAATSAVYHDGRSVGSAWVEQAQPMA